MRRGREIDLMVRGSLPGAEIGAPGVDIDALDWGFVVDSAFRHRIAALLGVNLARAGWFEPEGRQDYVHDAFRAARALNERRNRILIDETVGLVGMLEDAGVRVAVRKGAYLTPAVYRDAGLRPMNDIDLFVERSDAPRAAAVLKGQGYAAGVVDARGDIQALSRQQSVFWNMHVSNLPTMHRPSGDAVMPTIAVDVCFDLFLPASGCRLPARELLSDSVTFLVGAHRIPALRPEHFLLDVAAHLHKESTTLRYIEKRKHQRLLQYVDIATLVAVHADLDWDLLVATTAGAGAPANVYFGLANAERLFPGTIPSPVLEKLAREGGVSEEFLRSYGQVDLRQPLWWSATDIGERLFSDEAPAAASQSPV